MRIVARKADQPVDHVSGYVFQTAGSVLTDRARRRGVRASDAHVPFDPERHGGIELDAHRHATGREELNAAMDALRTLPARTRTVFLLNRIDGHRYKEIGIQLGISVSAVEKHMVRAVRHLTSFLRDKG